MKQRPTTGLLWGFLFLGGALSLYGWIQATLLHCDCRNNDDTHVKKANDRLGHTNGGRAHHNITYTYRPSKVEEYVVSHLSAMGFDTAPGDYASGCHMWNVSRARHPYVYQLLRYQDELKAFAQRFREFPPVPDVRRALREHPPSDQDEICKRADLHPAEAGLAGLFHSGVLSWSSTAGYAEPLLPPLRHPFVCVAPGASSNLNLGYLLHDFGHLCRQLRPHSQIVLFDLGASLSFHGLAGVMRNPPVYLMATFRKFGLPFDHVYAYEAQFTKPERVYQNVPPEYLPAYHWFNVPVDADPKSPRNPWNLLLEKYTPDDLVVVKLDIDTPHVELPLVDQIVHNPQLAKLIDLFYFEHHVHLQELKRPWGKDINGSVADSVRLFRQLRERGVMAHSWV